jgi:hypothetical protein
MENLKAFAWLIGFLAITTWAQQSSEVTGWKMQDSATVGATAGTAITSSTYDASSWYAATVPGTVLNTLVDQGVYPDPNYGENMINIPDLAGQQKRYWFRATFNVAFTAGQRVWLELGGINYAAAIFLNGQQVGAMLGAFKEAKFDVTDIAVSGANYLAVKIRGNYNPGVYHTKQSGSCGGNGGTMTQDGPTFIASQGWDWIPTIPDRCMGIWKPVYVRVTGPVVIRRPWIRTLNVSSSSATVPLQVMLRNSTASAISGTLTANIDATTSFTPQTVTVPASDTLIVQFPNLSMTNPRLWWPNGYGEPNLYTCSISFTPSGGSVSDTVAFQFGVRQFSYSTGSAGGYLIISCNGQRILSRGGNWGMDDAMKRWDLHKLENKVRYHKEMNFNMLRDWIGMTDNEPFYSFCDRYGIMVWSDFWQPYGPADGPEPTDLALFKDNELDKIFRARNHACIAVWCARNETAPNAALLTYLQNTHTAYDSTRLVQPSSGSNGAHSGGPYTYTSPASAYSAITGFHTEFGGPTVPSYETMNAFLPEANQMPMGNTWWSFHDYCSGNGTPSNFTNAMTTLFGSPTTIQQCCQRSQVMNYDDYRAAFEALQAKRFSGATGLLLWMSNCVWPSTMWQTYDYYMEGTGAMYGCQKGSEPIHIMYYGSGSYNVSVVNNTMQPIANYSASATTYNLDGTIAWNKTAAVNVAADTAHTNALGSAITAGTTTPYFLNLKLADAAGKVVSKNFYWLPSSGANIASMLTMGKATLKQVADATMSKNGAEYTISFQVLNSSAVCAIACRLLLTKATSGARILPAHYNDNYFSLPPGDTQTVEVKFDDIDKGQENPKLSITGVNVAETFITLPQSSVFRGVERTITQGMYARYSGKCLRIRTAGAGKTWDLAIFDMNGRRVLNKEGMARSDASVSLTNLRSGAYIATIKSGVEIFRTFVTIAKQ